MRNFNKFTLGVLLAGTIGFTSCVEEEVSKEVSAIYQGHASLLNAQANEKQAQADYKAAQTAYQAAQTAYQEAQNAYQALVNADKAAQNEADAAQYEAQIAQAAAAKAAAEAQAEATRRAMEEANEEHLLELMRLKKEMQDLKDAAVSEYTSDYMMYMGNVKAYETDLIYENVRLADLVFDLANYTSISDDADIERIEFDIVALEKGLMMNEERLALLEAVLSDPTSTGAQVLAAQQQKDALKAENEEKQLKIDNIADTMSNYGNDLFNYNSALGNLESNEGNLAYYNTQEIVLAKQLTDSQDLLDELTEGTPITHAEAVADASAKNLAYQEANTSYNEKANAYNDAQTLGTQYNTLITSIANYTGAVESIEISMAANTASLVGLQADYDAAKAAFDLDPTGKTVTNPGADGKAGNANDNSGVSYYEVTGVAPYTFGAILYTSFGDLPNGAVVGNNVGEYRNVESDDTTNTNRNIFTAAQTALTNMNALLANQASTLASYNDTLDELQDEADEFDTNIAAQIATARAELDAATEARTLALEARTLANEVLNAVDAISNVEEAILYNKEEVARFTRLVEEAKARVASLGLLVDDTMLAQYNADLKEMSVLNAERQANFNAINKLDAEIVYLSGLELGLDSSDFSGADYEARMERVAARIVDEKHEIVDMQEYIADAKQDIENIKQGIVDDKEVMEADIAELEIEIARIESEIERYTTLADRAKALMEEALGL